MKNDFRPQALSDQLRWVHDMLRRDLVTVRRLADSVAAGATPDDIHAGLRALQSGGPLFQLRMNCLGYCQVVHAHHRNEDDTLFPAIRLAAPQLRRTIDRLEADHRVVARLLDQVEEHASGLDGPDARQLLVDSLSALSTHLLEHLEAEEVALRPILDSWSAWPEQAPPEIRERVRAESSRPPD